jgi:hypothetical protein
MWIDFFWLMIRTNVVALMNTFVCAFGFTRLR